jgi:hypothetical protein
MTPRFGHLARVTPGSHPKHKAPSMRKLLSLATLATAMFAGNASAAWSFYVDQSGAKYVGDATWNNVLEKNVAGVALTAGANITPAGIYINPADTTNSWVMYEANLSVTAGTRDIIVFRNPQSARMAPVLKSFQDQIALGKKLILIRNATAGRYTITNGWEGWLSQTSYDVNPGDKVMFYFK